MTFCQTQRTVKRWHDWSEVVDCLLMTGRERVKTCLTDFLPLMLTYHPSYRGSHQAAVQSHQVAVQSHLVAVVQSRLVAVQSHQAAPNHLAVSLVESLWNRRNRQAATGLHCSRQAASQLICLHMHSARQPTGRQRRDTRSKKLKCPN